MELHLRNGANKAAQHCRRPVEIVPVYQCVRPYMTIRTERKNGDLHFFVDDCMQQTCQLELMTDLAIFPVELVHSQSECTSLHGWMCNRSILKRLANTAAVPRAPVCLTL